jgi:hypothetical protein
MSLTAESEGFFLKNKLEEGFLSESASVLLGTQNYDDSRCYQDNHGPIAVQRKVFYAHA